MRAALRLLEQREARRVAFTAMLERVEREGDDQGWISANQMDAELGEVIARAKSARQGR